VLHAEATLFPDPDPAASQVKKVIGADNEIRARTEKELGIWIPGMLIRPTKDRELKARQYVVMLHETPLASAVAPRNRWEQHVVSAEIGPTVRRYLDTYLGFTEVQKLLVQLAAAPPNDDARRLATAALSGGHRLRRLVQVLQRLVRETVPVTKLPIILKEVERSLSQEDVGEVVERLRPALVEQLRRPAPGISLGPTWEARIERWAQRRDGKRFLAIPADEEPLLQTLLDLIATRILETPDATIVVPDVPDGLRGLVGRLTAGRFPLLPVLASREWPGSSDQLQPLEATPPPEGVE
jgi:flagellar biosynthesis component FlhA